jgi:hypothetical protein
MNEVDRETVQEMNAPHFTNYDPDRLWVVVRKDYEEGSRAMWRESERFSTQDEARKVLRTIRENQAAYEDRTGYEPMTAYKIVEQSS